MSNIKQNANHQGATLKGDEGTIWRPVRFRKRDDMANEGDRRTEELLGTLQSLFNKLSVENFCKITDKFKMLMFNETEIFDRGFAMLVEKAIMEPLFSKWYLEMIASVSATLTNDEIEDITPYSFHILFVERLISVFEGVCNCKPNIGIEKRKEIEECTDVIRKNELKEQLNETEFMFQVRFVGIGRVIGEAFNTKIFTLSSLSRCIDILLSSGEEKSLKCLCTLLTTIGGSLEFHLHENEINEYFNTIKKISERSEISLKSRFMLLNLLEFKENSWTSREVLRNLESLGEKLNLLLTSYKNNDGHISESEFLVEEKDAQCVNEIYNKFTKYPRNLAEVLNSFNKLAVTDRTNIVRIFVTCVVKGNIYSEDCGKLFAVLLQARSVIIDDIIRGTKTVIRGYSKNFIYADQQICNHLKEIFKPLLAHGIFSVQNLKHDSDVTKGEKIVKQNEKEHKKKARTEIQTPILSWRRGIPVKSKKKETKSNEPETIDYEGKVDES